MVIAYAVLVIIGGIMGFVKAKSFPSLMMGISFGIGLLGSAAAMLKNSRLGFWAASTLITILTLFFAFRFIKTHLFMPAGLMCIVGVVVIAALVYNRNRK